MKLLRIALAFISTFSYVKAQSGQTVADINIVEAVNEAEEFTFETEVNKVMDIIIHSLYKTKGNIPIHIYS